MQQAPQDVEGAAYAALCRLGVGRATDIAREAAISVDEIDIALDALRTSRKVESLADTGGLQRPVKAPLDLNALGTLPCLVHNHPPAIQVARPQGPHPNVPSVSLDAALAALISTAQQSLTIVSPFVDQTSIRRFLPEFDLGFQRRIQFNLLTRGILRREERTTPEEHRRRIDGIIELRDHYRAQAGSLHRFAIREFLEYGPDLSLQDPHGMGPRRLEATVHQKIVVQDDRHAYIGSGEFRSGSFRASGELGVILHGAYARVIADHAQLYISKSRPVSAIKLEDLLDGGGATH